MKKLGMSAAEKRDLLRKGMSREEIQQLEIQNDPVIWAEVYLKNPDNPRLPLKLRFYQKHMLRSDAQQKVYRCGRRVGKSIVLCIEMLWKAFCNEDRKVLVCAPYKNLVQQLWKDGFEKAEKVKEAEIKEYHEGGK